MADITNNDARLKLQFVASSDHSVHAQFVAFNVIARRFDLWNKLRQLTCLDPRIDKLRSYVPEVS